MNAKIRGKFCTGLRDRSSVYLLCATLVAPRILRGSPRFLENILNPSLAVRKQDENILSLLYRLGPRASVPVCSTV